MKHLKKVIVMPVLICLILSCEQKIEIKLDRVTELTNQLLSSAQFARLQIKLSDLNLAGSKYTDGSKNSILIPFVGRGDRKGLVSIFDANDNLRGVMEFEVLTNVPSDFIYPALQNKTFNGTFVFRTGLSKMSLLLENSKVTSSSMARMDGSDKAIPCSEWDQVGTALSCAYARMERLNWFERTSCNFHFLSCLTQYVLSCMIDKCPADFA